MFLLAISFVCRESLRTDASILSKHQSYWLIVEGLTLATTSFGIENAETTATSGFVQTSFYMHLMIRTITYNKHVLYFWSPAPSRPPLQMASRRGSRYPARNKQFPQIPPKHGHTATPEFLQGKHASQGWWNTNHLLRIRARTHFGDRRQGLYRGFWKPP